MWKLKILRKLELKTISRGETDIFNIENKGIFDVGSMGAVNWSSLLENKIYFFVQKMKKCQENLRQLGVGEGQWYVCLHIRTSFYHSSYMDEHRNSSVENYLEAINYIHSLGGVVIRLGDPVFLGYEDAYIDYPNTSFKSELMDLFLIKIVDFFGEQILEFLIRLYYLVCRHWRLMSLIFCLFVLTNRRIG